MANPNITIQKIMINVETNIEDEKTFPLTYDKIHNPTKSIVKKPNKKPDYPYFTPDVKYSETVLMRYMKQDYSLILQTFFVNSFFTKMINESNVENKKKEEKEDTNTIANHNIYMTLLFLFPTRYPQSANINSSFDKYICKTPKTKYKNLFPSSDTITSGIFGRIYDIKKEPLREYSYINTSSGVSSVTEIVWLNDVLNNPKYRELIDLLIQYNEWADERKKNIIEEIKSAETELIGSIKNSDLKITKDDINVIANQKNISYSKIDLANDIIFILKQYIVINDKNGNENKEYIYKLYNELFTNEENAIKKIVDKETNKINVNTLCENIKNVLFDLNIKKKNERYESDPTTKNVLLDFLKYDKIFQEENVSGGEKRKKGSAPAPTAATTTKGKKVSAPAAVKGKKAAATTATTAPAAKGKTKLVDYYKNQSYIDLKYKEKEIDLKDIEVTYGNNKYALNNKFHYIKNIDEVYEKLQNNDDFKKMLESIKKEINEKVEKYNRNYSNLSNISKYSSSQLIAIDINIDKAVKSMEILRDIQSLPNNKDDETFKTIMNAVDSLKLFFSESSIRENKLSGISFLQNKINAILKKSNEIKGLQLVNQYLFSDTAKGIYLYYDKKEKSSENEELLNELNKDKYSYFVKTVDYIKKNFENIKSTNNDLNEIMVSYFNNISNGFVEKVINKAKKVINNNEIGNCDNKENDLLNIGVTKKTNIKGNEPEFEIDIYMELIIGPINYENQQNIKCEYRDENIVAMWDKLTSNPNKFEVIKKTSAVKINKQDNGDKNKKNKQNGGYNSRRKKTYLNYTKKIRNR
jgi:hypothetical protein